MGGRNGCGQGLPCGNARNGCPSVSSIIKMATRTDKDQSLEDKVASVEAKMSE